MPDNDGKRPLAARLPSGAWSEGEEQRGERDGPENHPHFISQVLPNVWKQDKVQVTHCDRT